jgi:hypothetical protein
VDLDKRLAAIVSQYNDRDESVARDVPRLIDALNKCREQRNSWIIAHSDESCTATEVDDNEILNILRGKAVREDGVTFESLLQA